jgi:signal transduction histidine kinase
MEINPVHLLNHQIVRDLPFGVIVVDRSLKVSDWNGWMERVTGLTRGQVQGRELDLFLPDLPDHDAFTKIHSVFETGRLIRISSENAEQFLNFAEVPNHSKVLPMIQDTELRPLFDFEGEVAAVCIITHDVTERVLRLRDLETLNRSFAIAHRALEEANRVKSDFLANTSHELRTPLTSILGFVEILENDLAESRDEEKSFLANIRESAQHLLDLINNILRTAEIEAGKFEMNLRGLNLGEVLSEVLAKVHPVARHKGIEVTIEFDDFDLEVLADYEELMQVLSNVLDNAVKFTEEGSILITAYRSPEIHTQAIIQIHDTGPGIAPENMHLVFEPFRQADSSTTRRHGGTGLGLSISRSMMERMHGTIEVNSPGTGMGTTVTLRLDAVPATVDQTMVS